MKSKGAISTEHLINIRSPQLLNILPVSEYKKYETTVDNFKRKLDSFQEVPDQPGYGGYVGLQAPTSRSKQQPV